MAITARNTTTPDSADLRITVTGAGDDETAARAAAEAFMATSRYTVNATIYEVDREHTHNRDVWNFWAEH